MGRRNCNLKLQLQPYDHHQWQPMMQQDSPSPDQQQLQQQLTIFYNGRVRVCDVTELQARAIIMIASRAMMGKSPSTGGDTNARDREEEEEEDDSGISLQKYHYQKMPAAAAHSQMSSLSPSPTTALSMKRSLQRFLQKRRHRISATSPYSVQ